MLHGLRSLINKQIKQYLNKNNYIIKKMPPPLMASPESKIRIDFDFVLGHMLLRKKDPSDIFFVQIGAYDGRSNDPIYKYVSKYNWRGVLVEPQEAAYSMLVQNYSGCEGLIFENLTIADTDGDKELYLIDVQKLKEYLNEDNGSILEWAGQVASFSPDILSDNSALPQVQDLVIKQKVPCISFSSLIKKHSISNIDILQIDAQAYDYEIIKTIDFNKIKPSIIHYEHSLFSKDDADDCLNYLIGKGYSIAIENIDTIAYLS